MHDTRLRRTGTTDLAPKIKTCSLDGCESKHNAKGFCFIHYGRWHEMVVRCNNPFRENYKHYGGRGLFVCLGWSEHPANYLNDVGLTPFEGATVDRLNNDKGYTCGHCIECIENCWEKNWQWATKRQQALNRRPSKRTWYRGTKGAYRHKNRYQARIWIDGRLKSLGYFDTEKEAHEAYMNARETLA